MKKHKPDQSVSVPQRAKIEYDLTISEFPWSGKQKELIEIINDKATKFVFILGPAGSSKTMIGVYTALKAMQARRISDIVYVRQPVESSKFNIGYLKGDIQEKLTPYAQPLEDKLAEFLPPSSIRKLKDDSRIDCVPVGHMRGRSFNAKYILVDEGQNLAYEDFLLVMTRLGKHSKMIISGDMMQPDIKNSAFQKVASLFDDEESRLRGIRVFRFGKEDIFRDESLSYVIEKFENCPN